MRVLITGGQGFLAWHTAVRLRARHGVEAALIGRSDFNDQATLKAALAGIDTVIHLAGVNRAESGDAVEKGNSDIANTLSAAILARGEAIHVVFSNSIRGRLDSPYGRGKARAAKVLNAAVTAIDGTFADVRLPNLFGEHGRPAYNSFVASFCHEISKGRQPVVTGDKQVPLLHAQDAAEVLIGAAGDRSSAILNPDGEPHGVSEVLRMLVDFHEKYIEGQIPALPDKFSVDLFNTYRSYMFPQHFPFKGAVHRDQRGELFETVRVHGGTGQTFVSTTLPGATRGDHYHLRKIERFVVISGTAEIALRRLYDNAVVRFRVSGDDHSFVDMPTMWVHNITNIGGDELVTIFWADQLLNPAAPDTYWETVAIEDGKDIGT